MRAVLTTYDPVQLSFAEALLNDAHIQTTVLDASSSIMESLAGKPAWRLMVLSDEDVGKALLILRDGMTQTPPSDTKS